jgi:hypothetical protein
MYKDLYPGSDQYQVLNDALANGRPVYLVAFDEYFNDELDYTVYDWPPGTYNHGAELQSMFHLRVVLNSTNIDMYRLERA